MKVAVYGETNVGMHREHNEDAFLILCDLDKKWQEVNNIQLDLTASKGLFLTVADGMGGANAGEVASALAVKKVEEKVSSLNSHFTNTQQVQKYLNSIVFEAHTSIVKKAKTNDEMKGMGTTMVLGYMINNLFYIVWAGDSRAYVYNASRHKQLVPFSDDHSIVWSRVKNGEITPEEARLSNHSNLILNALGDSFQKPVPEFKKVKLETGDRIILCSDGLNSMLSDIGIQQIIDFNSNTKDTCQALISAACKAGGQDNITVLVADVIDAETNSSDIILPKKSKGRKWFRIGLILLLSLVALCIYYFRNEIISFLHNHTNLNLRAQKDLNESQNDNTDETPSTETETITALSDNSELLNKSNMSQQSETEIMETSSHPDKTEPISSTSKMKEDLEIQYKRIDVMMKDLMLYKPGGDMYAENETFCLNHEAMINNIVYQLDSIKSQIEMVVYASGSKIVSVTNQNKAAKILKTLPESINKLEALKEDILTTSNPYNNGIHE